MNICIPTYKPLSSHNVTYMCVLTSCSFDISQPIVRLTAFGQIYNSQAYIGNFGFCVRLHPWVLLPVQISDLLMSSSFRLYFLKSNVFNNLLYLLILPFSFSI